ncbi:hypothetical protein AG1IA_00051 [Rhizoctonia solani AG-1 IA]|uniref:Uncharacterized protein n=1 Tax=Thanatephorus cucumeris (strain AG1-IA) TaxID=983506 RepID=L8XB43_THACA|nr:hypothetical protein AG1IA_00051 [Rhizoctonia solani AG-1 IA]
MQDQVATMWHRKNPFQLPFREIHSLPWTGPSPTETTPAATALCTWSLKEVALACSNTSRVNSAPISERRGRS